MLSVLASPGSPAVKSGTSLLSESLRWRPSEDPGTALYGTVEVEPVPVDPVAVARALDL